MMPAMFGRRMGGAALLVACMTTAFAAPALAQQPTQAQQNAIRQSCRSDFQANCSGVATGGSAALSCLQQHAAQLSSPCQSAVSAVSGAATGGTASAPPASAAGTYPPPAAATPTLSPREKIAELRSYCGADFRRFCRGVPLGGGQGAQCLQANAQSLSPGCRNLLSQAAH